MYLKIGAGIEGGPTSRENIKYASPVSIHFKVPMRFELYAKNKASALEVVRFLAGITKALIYQFL